MKPAVLYVCYFPVREPLVENQVLAYLRGLAREGFDIHLLTFERTRPTAAQQADIRSALASKGIRWHWQMYHRRPSVPATLYDVAVGSATVLAICRRYAIRLLHARSHVAAAMTLAAQRLLGIRLLFDVRGLLAEEYIDGGRWQPNGVEVRLTKYAERTLFRRADAVVVLTEALKRRLVEQEPRFRRYPEDVTVIPCCVDTARFTGSTNRAATDGPVAVYAGQLGGWYPADDIARCFAALRHVQRSFRLEVLTHGDPAPLLTALAAAGVEPSAYSIRAVAPRHVPGILAAADVGLILDRRTSSAVAVSPTKLAEYLAAGLPIVASASIGDCDDILTRHAVGVILSDQSVEAFRRAAVELVRLRETPGMRSRCAGVARQLFTLDEIGIPRYAAIYRRLIGLPVEIADAARTERAASSSDDA